LTVGHANIEGECRDVRGRLEVLVCQVIGVHMAQNAREVLDMDGVPVLDEGMEYENGEELAHLYSKSGTGDSYMRCIHDAQCEHMIRKDVVSEDAQRSARRPVAPLRRPTAT